MRPSLSMRYQPKPAAGCIGMAQEAMSLLLRGRDIRTIDDLVQLMEVQLAAFDRKGDHRAAFLRVYMEMTKRVGKRMTSSFFMDHAWVERVAIRFAGYYFDALEAYDAGSRTPPAWKVAFDLAVRKQAFLLQDVLLGINAHINNDLPQVVADILRDEGDDRAYLRLARRRFDHDQINRILHEIIPVVEAEVGSRYGRLLTLLGFVMGRLDEALATHGLKSFRDRVWSQARFLLAADGEEERQAALRFVEQDALLVAQEIDGYLAPRWVRGLCAHMRRWRLC